MNAKRQPGIKQNRFLVVLIILTISINSIGQPNRKANNENIKRKWEAKINRLLLPV